MSQAARLEQVAVSYDRRTVLDLPSLEVTRGQTVALLGPNGAGKSTLLRVLGLLEVPSQGKVTLLGEEVGSDDARRLALRRKTATVFQDPLLCETSVLENVILGLRFRGVVRAEAERRAHRWLERFGIGGLAGRMARTLSGGEAQRASLARAFVLEPELLLLDEPFGSLDQHGREALALELLEVLREARPTTVLVTHERGEALLLADDAIVMLGGRVAQRGSPREVFDRPATLALARFVAMENLIPLCQLRRHLPDLEPDADGYAGLRAEDVVIGEADRVPPPGTIGLPARVARVLPAGGHYRIELDAGFPLVALVEKRVVARQGPDAGKPVTAWFDRAAWHFLPG